VTQLAKLIAFHLPQFYPTPYNDEWWGKGFTEWTNVTKARPRFRGHYQPHLPADLGFYDLRLPEARAAQAALASEYGIYGFCYYHYWFNGRRLLERPVDEILKMGTPDFPFCLCWANENWTRAWDGFDKQVLVQQTYSAEDDLNHLRWLANAFCDRRYIRVNGRPMFLVYRAASLKNPLETTDRWRAEALRMGIGELHLCHVESNFRPIAKNPSELGFDAAVQFQPSATLVHGTGWAGRIQRIFGRNKKNNARYPYAQLVNSAISQTAASYLRYPCVCPSWDNSSRRKDSCFTLTGTSPKLYEEWLRHAVANAPVSRGEKIVFINAWNEWSEGCHLEPCQRYGRKFLEATARVVCGGR